MLIDFLTPERIASFWEKVDRQTQGDCWRWKAFRNPMGYGMFGVKRDVRLAHRIAYELTYGEIPEGMCVLHRCDNPSCVNPSHLYLGTRTDNNRDKLLRGRVYRPVGDKNPSRSHPETQVRGEASPNAKLTTESVKQIRIMYATGKYRLVDIASQFGVSFSTIGRIVKRETWKHLP